MSIADSAGFALRPSEQKVREGKPRVPRAEREAPARRGIVEAIHLIPDDVAADLQIVRCLAERNAVAHFVVIVAASIGKVVLANDESSSAASNQ